MQTDNSTGCKPDSAAAPVAIIGMACRLPGAVDIEAFWENLIDGRNSITTFSDEELRAAGVPDELIRSPNYVKARGIINGADQFDAGFFGLTPREAEILDPQQRVFLECAWHALEDAAYDPLETQARIGVFAGAGTTWHLADLAKSPRVLKYTNQVAIVVSNDKDYLPTRTSYQLNLTGPSVNVQSACSTSLVAVVLGAEALRSGRCEMVLCGGITLEVPERKGYLFQEGGMESPDGVCRTFDAAANGTVFSRGCGVVLLKKLDRALADRDHIYAVIRDGAISNDGNAKVGFTAPGVEGQLAAEREALARAGLAVDGIGYVEAHGTATQLGDPIEVTALSRAFAEHTDKKQFCALGSVKTNIGHTDIAAGAAGLIKTALAIERGKIPASINFTRANQKIDFADSPFFVNPELSDWPLAGPRQALVNAFGVGGTNACVVLEEAPPVSSGDERRPIEVFPFSGRDGAVLKAQLDNFAVFLQSRPELDLADVAYTLKIGRRAFDHRLCLVADGRENLLQKLKNEIAERDFAESRPALKTPELVFMFPGQGNQYVNMGRELYQQEAVFRAAVDQCCEILKEHLRQDLRELLYPDAERQSAAAGLLDQTRFTQPALFVIAYAQARLWQAWGLEPKMMVGHSVGEYVAACLAEVFSLEEALKMVALRGALIQALPAGGMLAVLMPEEQLLENLPPGLEVAVVNSPELTVVAGELGLIDSFAANLSGRRIFCKKLPASHAFHSAMMDAVLQPFAESIREIKFYPPKIPIISTVTGQRLTDQEATSPAYWVEHVRRPVRFAAAVTTLMAEKSPVFLEVGAGRSLESAVKNRLSPEKPWPVISSIRAAADQVGDLDYLHQALGKLWQAGLRPDWEAYYEGQRRRRLSLPGYAFDRQRFLADFGAGAGTGAASEPDRRKKSDVNDWFYLPGWSQTPAPAALPRQAIAADAQSDNDPVWIIFGDPDGFGTELAVFLRGKKARVIQVTAAAGFAAIAADVFTVCPGRQEDYEKLCSGLALASDNEGRRPALRIVDLFNLDGFGLAVESRIDDLEKLAQTVKDKAFYGPLYLEKALIKEKLLDDLRFIVVLDGLCEVAGEKVVQPLKALAAGPARVVNREHKNVRGRIVDINLPPVNNPARARLARELLRETEITTTESLVAYRGGRRYVESFVPFRPEAAVQSDDFASGRLIKDGGLYLITGGLSGLGLHFAAYLAENTTRVRLVLTARQPLPEPEQWSKVLADPASDPAEREKIAALKNMVENGAEIMVRAVDVADHQAMQTLLQEVEKKFAAPLNGVIHSAGIAGGGVISLIEPEQAEAVFAAKVNGTLVLNKLLRHQPLDFFLLFSSVTAILGEGGRVDYCAANAFLDAFARYRNQLVGADCIRQQQPGLTMSLNWGQWGVIGMGASWENRKSRRRAIGNRIDRDRGLVVLLEENQQEARYRVQLDPDQDWVIAEHLIAGVPTLVGAAFFEILQSLFTRLEPGRQVILKNLFFLSPARFAAQEARLLELGLRQTSPGQYRFVLQSVLDEQRQDHFVGEVAIADQPAAQYLDPVTLRERLAGEVDSRPFERRVFTAADPDLPLIDLGRRWDALRELVSGANGESLALIELAEDFAADLKSYSFHPALLDVATSIGIRPLVTEAYLPLGYRRVTLLAPLPHRFYSHVCLAEDFTAAAETITLDITLMDEKGRVLAEIKRYTMKKVESSVNLRAQDKVISELNPEDAREILPAEGSRAFARALSLSDQAQLVISCSDFNLKIAETVPSGKSEQEKLKRDAAQRGSYGRPTLATPYVAPGNDIEQGIADIWQAVIGIDKVGVNDNFNDLGGNSLLAMQVIANVSEMFELEISVESFFAAPTVAGLAETVVNQLISLTDEETLDALLAEME